MAEGLELLFTEILNMILCSLWASKLGNSSCLVFGGEYFKYKVVVVKTIAWTTFWSMAMKYHSIIMAFKIELGRERLTIALFE